MTSRHEAQLRLLAELQTSGSEEAAERAISLRSEYHAQEMAALSQDVYDAARQAGFPPSGWTRVTGDLEALRAAMPGLDFTEEKLRDLLTPEKSGFRAEIYLPDPAVLGPGYKPTVVFKGSTGEVIENGVPRETALEDFLGNNLPQSIGLKTDYYDRAMDLATELRRHGIEFDLAGHSLGGGMASAASAVTGMRAVTFNAAGLHPETARDFARGRGNLPLYDTATTVTAWQVQGDLLNDGVQGDLRGMSDLQRERMGLLLSNAVDALRRTPEGRDYLETRLVDALPEASRPAVRGFLDRLQQGDATTLIRDLPEAAGERMPPLVAMTRQEHALVAREDRASMAELHQLGGPLLTVLAMGARGANVGAQLGQGLAEGGRVLGDGVASTGDAARAGITVTGGQVVRGWTDASVVLGQGTHALGEFAARARMAGAHGAAAIDHAQGHAQAGVAQAGASVLRRVGAGAGLVSDDGRAAMETRANRIESAGEGALERNRSEAAAAIGQGQAAAQGRRDAAGAIAGGIQAGAEAIGVQARTQLVYVGERLDAGLEVAGARITQVTRHAPTAGAGLGGVSGVIAGGALAFDPRTPPGVRHWSGAIELVREAGPAMTEAVGRHGMASAMLPSLERHIAEQEKAARTLLQEQEQEQGRDRKATSAPLSTAALLRSDEARAVLERLFSAVRDGDGEAAGHASSALIDSEGGRAWLADGSAQLAARALRAPDTGQAEVANAQARHHQAEPAPLAH